MPRAGFVADTSMNFPRSLRIHVAPFVARSTLCCLGALLLVALSGESWDSLSQLMPWFAALLIPGSDLAPGRVDAILARGANARELLLLPVARRSAPALVLAILLLCAAVDLPETIVAITQVLWVLLFGIMTTRFARSAQVQILTRLAALPLVATALRLPPHSFQKTQAFDLDRSVASAVFLSIAIGYVHLCYLSFTRPRH